MVCSAETTLGMKLLSGGYRHETFYRSQHCPDRRLLALGHTYAHSAMAEDCGRQRIPIENSRLRVDSSNNCDSMALLSFAYHSPTRPIVWTQSGEQVAVALKLLKEFGFLKPGYEITDKGFRWTHKPNQ